MGPPDLGNAFPSDARLCQVDVKLSQNQILIFFCGTGYLTQGLACRRQALCHWAIAFALAFSFIFVSQK